MKKVLFFASMLFLTGTLTINSVMAQKSIQQFDNKQYVEGELLIQTSEKGEIRRILAALPEAFQAEIIQEVSKPMRIFYLSNGTESFGH